VRVARPKVGARVARQEVLDAENRLRQSRRGLGFVLQSQLNFSPVTLIFFTICMY